MISTRRIFRSGSILSRKAIHDLSRPDESELLARQAFEIAVIPSQLTHLSSKLLVLQQQRGDALLDRGLLADERAQMQESPTPEQDGRNERQRHGRRGNDREALPEHSVAQLRLTHRRGSYTSRRPKHKHGRVTVHEEGVRR